MPESNAVNIDRLNLKENGVAKAQHYDTYNDIGRITSIDRKVYDQHTFDAEFGYEPDSRGDWELFRRWAHKNCECSSKSIKNWLLARLPIVRRLQRYDYKNDLLPDITAGVTVGIMHIPQSMAYSLLATLPPVHGIYTSFFPCLLYAFFGTSGHMSLGTDAVTSLLTAAVREQHVPDHLNLLSENYDKEAYQETLRMRATRPANQTIEEEFQERIHPIVVIGTLTLLIGIFQIVLGLLHAGVLKMYLSSQLISGYTSGAAVIIFASQFDKLFGVKLEVNRYGPLSVFYKFGDTFVALPEQINWTTTIISACCILVIGLVKIYINERYKEKLKIPVPIDLIVIIVVTVISYFTNLKVVHAVDIVEEVPTGFADPQIPDLSYIVQLIPDAIKMAVIIYALSVSMAQIFATRHRYEIEANQELYAYGIVNVFGSFFSTYPSSASIAVTCVQESAGSKTQLTSGFAAILLLVAIFWLVAYLEPLPLCVLSAIIVVALKNLFLQLRSVSDLWKKSKIDCLIFIVAFISTVIAGATWGLVVSVIFAAFTVVLRSQRPKCLLLGHVSNTDLYKSAKKYSKIEEISGVKIFRYDSALHYANADLFRNQLYNYINIDFQALRDQVADDEKLRKKQEKSEQLGTAPNKLSITVKMAKQVCGWFRNERESNGSFHMTSCSEMGCAGKMGLKLKESVGNVIMKSKLLRPNRIQTLALERNPNLPHYIIIDCSGFNYLDVTGVEKLTQVYAELKEINIDVLFVGCKDTVRQKFEKCGFHVKVPMSALLVEVHDAVTVALATSKDQKQTVIHL